MKLPKSLLAAMALGIVVGTTTSCEKLKPKDFEQENAEGTCGETGEGNAENGPTWDDCPMCGMG